jgi:hypothetical protein
MVDDLRNKLEYMNVAISQCKAKIRKQTTYIMNFKADIYNVV